MTALSSISFPACERNLVFQFPIRLLDLSIIPGNSLTLDLAMREGKPKYFSKLDVLVNPVTCFDIISCWLLGIFAKKQGCLLSIELLSKSLLISL